MRKKLLLPFLFALPISMYAQTYIMSSGTTTTCSGTFMDPGGAGNYADNSNFVQTFCSGTSSCVSITFTTFSLESGFDYLAVYDGPNTSSPQIAGSPFTGAANPGTLTCSSGCMTFAFTSDFSITDVGWLGTLSCVTCPPPPPPPDLSLAWIQKASNPGPGRHRSTAITIGNRGYAGFGHITTTPEVVYDDWWEYDPGTNSWTQKANYAGGSRLHACGFTIGNFGYVGTGRDAFGATRNDYYKYDPTTNIWTAIASIPDGGLRGAASFAINGKGYVITGSYSNECWEYNPITNFWIAKAPFPGTPRSSSAYFAIGLKGYVGTGDNGSLLNDFWEFDPALNIWTAKATFGGVARTEAGGFALNGKGYIGTGFDYTTGNLSDFWRYDPATNTWGQVANYSGSPRRYLSCFTIDLRAYGVFGTSGTNYNDLWEYGSYAPLSGIGNPDLNANSITSYPNPFTDKITFSISKDALLEKNNSLTIFDINGKIVKQFTHITDHEVTVERADMANGIYFFEFQNNNSRTTGKFIAQ